MSYSTRHCPVVRIKYTSEEEYTQAVRDHMKKMESLGYKVLSYPDSRGYFEVEKI
jgi:hypothetical protein